MQPNGNGNGSNFVGNVKSVFSIANPIIAIVATVIVIHTNQTVQTAVQSLKSEMQEQTAKLYESRETAAMARAAVQDKLFMDQRERDNLRSQIQRLDERIRDLEKRR